MQRSIAEEATISIQNCYSYSLIFSSIQQNIIKNPKNKIFNNFHFTKKFKKIKNKPQFTLKLSFLHCISLHSLNFAFLRYISQKRKSTTTATASSIEMILKKI